MTHDPEGAPVSSLAWLTEIGRPARRLESLPGDVSTRRYSRVHLAAGGSLILAIYPEGSESTFERFLATTALLAGAGVPVPRIVAADRARRRMLLEDAGRRTLHDVRDRGCSELEPYYREAIELARRLTRIDPERVAGLNPPLDAGLLRRELEQTWQVLLGPRGLAGDAVLSRRLDEALDELSCRLGEPTAVVCHRDFMVRNLIPSGAAPGLQVIDHQDLRLGPRFYDFASLLNDSFFPPPELEARLLGDTLESEDDRLAYSRAVVQRCLKAAGTFAAFTARGNPRHERLIRPSLERAASHLAELPETAHLASELDHRWRESDLLD